jgi:hypothetical protein
VRFVPVALGIADLSAGKLKSCNSFALAPSPGTELTLKAHDVTNSAPDSDGFDLLDPCDDRKCIS